MCEVSRFVYNKPGVPDPCECWVAQFAHLGTTCVAFYDPLSNPGPSVATCILEVVHQYSSRIQDAQLHEVRWFQLSDVNDKPFEEIAEYHPLPLSPGLSWSALRDPAVAERVEAIFTLIADDLDVFKRADKRSRPCVT